MVTKREGSWGQITWLHIFVLPLPRSEILGRLVNPSGVVLKHGTQFFDSSPIES